MSLCLQALEEQISQEESSSQALREEVLAKEQNVLELHTAMKEVRQANPEILSCFLYDNAEKLNWSRLCVSINLTLMLTTAFQLSVQNQELMEQNLTLQEQMNDPEQKSTSQASSALQPAGAHLTQRLHLEIASCLSDLRSLCSILTQRAQGQDPNLSLLLGLTCKYCVMFSCCNIVLKYFRKW